MGLGFGVWGGEVWLSRFAGALTRLVSKILTLTLQLRVVLWVCMAMGFRALNKIPKHPAYATYLMAARHQPMLPSIPW